MPPPKPLGLALSGGGFRAAAFHLGVLKRLRDLKLLGEVDVLSTVSGGSITGAFWLYFQVCRGDTLASDKEWNDFERTLVELMLKGLFGQLLWRTLLKPLLPVAIGMCLFYLGLLSLVPGMPTHETSAIASGLLVLFFLLALITWHYRATLELEGLYNRYLFHGKRLTDLSHDPIQGRRQVPYLAVNAAGLKAGNLYLFVSKLKEEVLQSQHYEDRIDYQILPIQTPKQTIAEAVAASSAIPHVFAPLEIVAEIAEGYPRDVANEQMTGKQKVTDGGIFDNQGTQALMSREFLCRAIIGSDGSAALTVEEAPSSWLLPVSRGRLMRAQNIIYERSRDFGYVVLSSRDSLFRILEKIQQAGIDRELINDWRSEVEPVLEGYGYVELEPVNDFPWQKRRARLPKSLCRVISRVRTHVDAFTPLELSALMFHGYTQIDHCLRAYHKEWILEDAPLNFQSAVPQLNEIKWIGLSKKELRAYKQEMRLSHLGPVMRRIKRLYSKLNFNEHIFAIPS
jgi:predicted acylesterase/phospholipase RssA